MKITIKREQSQTGLSFAEREKFGPKVKKIFQWALAAALICGASVFTSCSGNDDNPVTPDLNLSEKIIGKWLVSNMNGKPLTTNDKSVYTFVSPTKAYISSSITSHPDLGDFWNDEFEGDVTINGNKMTLIFHPEEHMTLVETYNFTDFSDTEFTASHNVYVTIDGNVIKDDTHTIRFTKLNRDYSQAVLGLWECTGLTGIETYNDANARLEFLADGTYRYYRQDDNGQWQAVTTREFQDYFVDGTLLATRWKNEGEDELREWWEIASLADGQMLWTALRQNADGTTAQQGMTWKKIDLNIPEKIIGKWIETEVEGRPALTNEKAVTTFVSATKALFSSSLSDYTEKQAKWSDRREYAVKITGNKVSLTGHPESDPTITLIEDFFISSVTATEIVCKHRHTTIRGGQGDVSFNERNVRLTKTDVDYRQDVVGTWEGKNSEGWNERWQIKADGTYVYSRKVGDADWVQMVDDFNQYVVDGYLFYARWKNDTEGEQRQWWEIESIQNGVMKWKSLRQNAAGTTSTATLEMEKVE